LVLFSTSHVQYTIPIGICQGNEVYEKKYNYYKKRLAFLKNIGYTKKAVT